MIWMVGKDLAFEGMTRRGTGLHSLGWNEATTLTTGIINAIIRIWTKGWKGSGATLGM